MIILLLNKNYQMILMIIVHKNQQIVNNQIGQKCNRWKYKIKLPLHLSIICLMITLKMFKVYIVNQTVLWHKCVWDLIINQLTWRSYCLLHLKNKISQKYIIHLVNCKQLVVIIKSAILMKIVNLKRNQ